ncbi:hypothetical protein AJ87_24345 [Rhizobium yanglingense]|nr:hypothetical protein AJ87_24345 [Rhizobium yanglingense]
MSRRLRSAEHSDRDERKVSPSILTALMQTADFTAPRDPRKRGDHYRNLLVDAHRTIEILQRRINDIETERDTIKRQAEYDQSLCVARTVAEEARLAAFRLARGKASILAEGRDGTPTNLSNAIDNIPDPKPKWSK